MRRTTYLIIALLVSTVGYSQADVNYIYGYEEGYREGWAFIIPYSECPPVLFVPEPVFPCDHGYRCGYNQGLFNGAHDAKAILRDPY
jgi:hypothetical protein